MSFYQHVHYVWAGNQSVVWTPNTGVSPGPIPVGPARRLNTFASSAQFVNWHGFVASSAGPVIPVVGDIITQGLATGLLITVGYHCAGILALSGDIITQGLATQYLITQGFTGGGIQVYPDPFAATSLVVGVDPFSAVSIVSGVDPFAATSRLFGS